MTNSDAPPRTVHPRKPSTNADRPIVTVIDGTYCTEDGTIGDTTELVTLLRKLPPQTVVTADDSIRFLALVREQWTNSPGYQDCCTPIARLIFRPRVTHRTLYSLHNSVKFFGWQKEKCGRSNTVRNRYHLLIDPATFCDSGRPKREHAAMMEWAKELRAFCVEQNKNLAPTAGAVGRQFLRDPRFYPNARRKVPRATNDKAREHLPANCYRLGVNDLEDIEYSAEYLDQTKAHHFHAQNVRLPNANTLYGYKSFRCVPSDKLVGITNQNRVERFLEGFSGLVFGHIWWPVNKRVTDNTLLPEFLQDYTKRVQEGNYGVQAIWTADLPLLEEHGARLTSITGALGSYDVDTGLAAYGKWATEYSGKNPSKLLKAILLTPYGALATTPSTYKVAFHHAKGGTPQVIRSKSGIALPFVVRETRKESEPGTNNVIHRGLIEASTRAEVLMYANYLQQAGHRILCVYVDGVIIESSDKGLPPLWLPWRHAHHLTHLRFLSPTQFVSAELSKLPGQSRRLPERTREERALAARVGRFKLEAEKQEHWRPAARRTAAEVRREAIERHDAGVRGP